MTKAERELLLLVARLAKEERENEYSGGDDEYWRLRLAIAQLEEEDQSNEHHS